MGELGARLETEFPDTCEFLRNALRTGNSLRALVNIRKSLEEAHYQAVQASLLEAPEGKQFAYRLKGDEVVSFESRLRDLPMTWQRRSLTEEDRDRFFVGKSLQAAPVKPLNWDMHDPDVDNTVALMGDAKQGVEPPRAFRLHLGYEALTYNVAIIDYGSLPPAEQYWPFEPIQDTQLRVIGS
jgi:hypothetical protein